MNCIDAQRLILPFINNKLSIEQLEGFTNHVSSCKNCMEELEVYYVLMSGMKQLDEDKELSTNFHQDLLTLLKQSEDRIFREKILHIRKRIILLIVIVFAAFISSFRLGELVVEDVLDNKITESNYLMDNLFYDLKIDLEEPQLLNRGDILPRLIMNNLEDIYVYLQVVDPEGAKKMKERFKEQIKENGK